MSASPPTGWGGGPSGSTPWGGGGSLFADNLTLVSAVAVRENVCRLTFNTPVALTGVLDPHDASSRYRYSVVPVAGTVGMDGLPSRPVTAVQAVLADVIGSEGTMVDVTMDRGFSPFPAQYRITVNNLVGEDGAPLDATQASYVFYGVQRERVPNQPQKAAMTKDLANPFDAASAVAVNPNQLVLGAFAVDDTGDLAFDEGLATLKKRIARRLFTRKGGFSYMPDYGVGLLDDVKKLGTQSVKAGIKTRCETQVALEPEIRKVKVVLDTSTPFIARLTILGKTIKGAGLKLEQVFNISTGS